MAEETPISETLAAAAEDSKSDAQVAEQAMEVDAAANGGKREREEAEEVDAVAAEKKQKVEEAEVKVAEEVDTGPAEEKVVEEVDTGAAEEKVVEEVDTGAAEEKQDVEAEETAEKVSKAAEGPVKVGYKEFGTSVEMFDYFFKLLHFWTPNLNLNKYEHTMLLDLINKGHPEPERKIGAGVHAFQVRNHPFYKSRCFFLVREDETSDDFSFRKCVDHILPLPESMQLKPEVNKALGGGNYRGGRSGGGGGRGGGRGQWRGRGRGGKPRN